MVPALKNVVEGTKHESGSRHWNHAMVLLAQEMILKFSHAILIAVLV